MRRRSATVALVLLAFGGTRAAAGQAPDQPKQTLAAPKRALPGFLTVFEVGDSFASVREHLKEAAIPVLGVERMPSRPVTASLSIEDFLNESAAAGALFSRHPGKAYLLPEGTGVYPPPDATEETSLDGRPGGDPELAAWNSAWEANKRVTRQLVLPEFPFPDIPQDARAGAIMSFGDKTQLSSIVLFVVPVDRKPSAVQPLTEAIVRLLRTSYELESAQPDTNPRELADHVADFGADDSRHHVSLVRVDAACVSYLVVGPASSAATRSAFLDSRIWSRHAAVALAATAGTTSRGPVLEVRSSDRGHVNLADTDVSFRPARSCNDLFPSWSF